ncbi:unnamed protein product [Alternaria alternata]
MFGIRTITATGVIASLLSSSSAQYFGTLNATSGPTPKTVKFPSGDSHVVGHLYLPERYDSAQRYPAVAVAGSFISVKEMMSGTYAVELARHDVIAIAIDYRNFGQSGGDFRQYEDPTSKAEDLSAALEYLAMRSDVAGTGLLGVCTSGGNVLFPAGSDPRVQAVATVVGFFNSPSLVTRLRGEEGIAVRRAVGRKAQQLYNNTGEIELIPAYSSTTNVSANFGLQPYYENHTRGGGAVGWRNEFAVASWGAWLDWDPVTQAGNVTVPTLMIHSENAAFPDQARTVYNRLGPQKEIIWTNGTHYDFYDNPHTVRFSAEKVAQHFKKYLL